MKPWDHDAVPIRPDDHVAWQAREIPGRVKARDVLLIVLVEANYSLSDRWEQSPLSQRH
jgi:hypothetical protein